MAWWKFWQKKKDVVILCRELQGYVDSAGISGQSGDKYRQKAKEMLDALIYDHKIEKLFTKIIEKSEVDLRKKITQHKDIVNQTQIMRRTSSEIEELLEKMPLPSPSGILDLQPLLRSMFVMEEKIIEESLKVGAKHLQQELKSLKGAS